MRPTGRILTYMPFRIEMFGRISVERLVSVDAKFFLGAFGFLPACATVPQSPAKRRPLYQKISLYPPLLPFSG
jgi:hypothetical protein